MKKKERKQRFNRGKEKKKIKLDTGLLIAITL